MTERQQGTKTGGTTSGLPGPKKKQNNKELSTKELSEKLVDLFGSDFDPENDRIKTAISQMRTSDAIKDAVRAKIAERYPEVRAKISTLISTVFDLSDTELLDAVLFFESKPGRKFSERHLAFSESINALMAEESSKVMSAALSSIAEEQGAAYWHGYKQYLLPIRDWHGGIIES